jgi:hypothetical protein
VLQYVRGCMFAISMFKALSQSTMLATSIRDGTEARRLAKLVHAEN